MSKQTAVNWLIEQIYFKQVEVNRELLDQALEMEKNQINKACYDGYYQEELYDIREYYNETYK